MLQKVRNHILYLAVLVIFVSGCALGVTRVEIKHEPINPAANKKKGNIIIKQFVDKRKDIKSPDYIGNKRNMYGMVLGHIGTKEGEKLEVILTKYFAEALEAAGYNTFIAAPQSTDVPAQVKFDAMVESEILDFWLDLYMAVWHKVGVKVKATKLPNLDIIWEREIRGEQSNVLWIGATGEFEKVISQALTKALEQAVTEFSSDDFYKVISK